MEVTMMRLFRSLRRYGRSIRLFGVMAATTVLACSDSEPTDPIETGAEPLPAVAISITPNSATLLLGEVAYLSAIAVNSRNQAVSTIVEWSSANPGIATVGRTSGTVTAVGVGSTTITVSSQALVATASITVREYHPAARILISPLDELILSVGTGQRLTGLAVDDQGRFTPAPVEWMSEDPGIATISKVDGQVTAIAPGTTTLIATAGAARATMPVQVVPENFLMQWASSATASSQYESDLWSTTQATGAPNVLSCNDESKAWASAGANLDWLELQYVTPVRASEIRIYEVWAPGSIVKVELKDVSGAYHSVYTASPQLHSGCLRVLRIPITSLTEPVTAIRLTLDQRVIGDWNEIDAVRLLGYRIN
jgi:hypothetical protein